MKKKTTGDMNSLSHGLGMSNNVNSHVDERADTLNLCYNINYESVLVCTACELMLYT